MRPAGEYWSVTLTKSASTVRLDFARDTDAVRSITVALDGDDDQHSQVFRLVCKFVGPTGRPVSGRRKRRAPQSRTRAVQLG
jgi:hypothetical protein